MKQNHSMSFVLQAIIVVAFAVVFSTTAISQDITEVQRQERCQNSKNRIAELESQLRQTNEELAKASSSRSKDLIDYFKKVQNEIYKQIANHKNNLIALKCNNNGATIIISDGTSDLPKPKIVLPGPTNNVTQTAMPPGYSEKPGNPTPSWGPYTVDCDAAPLASVPYFSSFAVEDEKSILDNIASSCVGAADDAITALVGATENIINVSAKLGAVWNEAFQNRNPQQTIKTGTKLNDATTKIIEEEKEKTKKAFGEAVEKTTELLDKIKELAAGPEMYVITCMWDGIKDFATPEDIKMVQKTNESYGKAKTAMQEKLEAIKTRSASGESPKWSDKALFTDWSDVKEKVQKTTTGLNAIAAYISDPQKLLPYETQMNRALATAESMVGTVMTDCQIRELDRQVRQGIAAGQATLIAARKLAAQKLKCASKWRQKINDYVNSHLEQKDRGWEYYPENDIRRTFLPQGHLQAFIDCSNEAKLAESEKIRLEEPLRKLGALCSRIRPIAVTLNERVNKYEGIYTKGLIAAEDCKWDGAENCVQQLKSLESSECGHFFPRPYGVTKSEELEAKIKTYKQIGKCNDKPEPITKKQGGAILNLVGPDMLRTNKKDVLPCCALLYTEYEYTPTSAKMTVQNDPPDKKVFSWEFSGIPSSLTPGDSFIIKITGSVTLGTPGDLSPPAVAVVRVTGLTPTMQVSAWANGSTKKEGTYKFRVPMDAELCTIEISADYGIGTFARYTYKPPKK